MIRRIITVILNVALRVYFRRIEVTGLDNVPKESPVIFVLNHPNALVDPVFLLCLAPRRIAFVAKAPLFRMPVIGFLVRSLDSLPAYRRQDQGEDVARNLETFAAARQLLARGIAIGICPEGVSHNEPRLKPLKTGAARLAIAAVASGEIDLQIVPAGLYYTAKTSFRSSALLHFAEPIKVKRVALEADGTPPRAEVRELSAEIENALREVILHAEQEEALGLIDRAERIFSAAELDEPDEEQRLARSLQLRQRFLEGFAFYRSDSPRRLDAIELKIARFESEMKQAGIDAADLSLPPTAARTILRLLLQVLSCALLAPFAILGIILHYPAYRLVGYLARRLATEQDVLSTFKIIGSMLLFPLTWTAVGLIVWRFFSWQWAAASLVVVPLCGYVAVRFVEELDRFIGSFAALAMFLTRRRSFVRLLAERDAIRREILELGSEVATRV